MNDVTVYIGVCYGFEVMQVAESPNTPFTVLHSRFKEGLLNIMGKTFVNM